MADSRHLEKSQNRHISAAVSLIWRKFGMLTHVDNINPVDH